MSISRMGSKVLSPGSTGTSTTRGRKRFRRSVIGAAVGVGVLAGGLPASAAVYSGNYCGSARWYEQTVGGAACTFLVAKTSSYVTVQLGALDAVSDGLSMRNNTRVDQYNAAGSFLGSNYMVTANSSGAVTTGFSGNGQVNRRAGATIFRIVLTATRFNAPTGVVYNTDTTSWGYYW